MHMNLTESNQSTDTFKPKQMTPKTFHTTIMPTKSDSDVVFCLQLLSKTLTLTINLR